MIKIDSNKIKNQVEQILNILAKKPCLFFLFLIIIYCILGGILIHKYNALTQKTEIYTTEKKQSAIKENAYQEILEHWDVKKIKFNEIGETIYPDPFIEKTQNFDEQKIGEEQGQKQEQLQQKQEQETKQELNSKEENTTISESFFGKINTLFGYYISQGKRFLSINERAKIWEQEGLGTTEEYQGFYNQNINLLEQLTK